jgi:tetratricopeptide (TPR) repeat protein
MAETIGVLLPPSIKQRMTNEWASQEVCERALGLTDWNRRDVFDNVVRRLGQPPFTGQPDNSRRVSFWRTQLNEVSQRLTATNAIAAQETYLSALQRSPGDFRLHWNFAEFLEATGDLPRALEEWRRVQSLIPHHHVGLYQVGRLLAAQGQRDEAREWLDRAVALRPDLGAGWLELGKLSLTEGRGEEALRHFTRAQQLLPQDPRIPFHAAKALSQLKRPDEAIQQAREAVRLDPDFWEKMATQRVAQATVVSQSVGGEPRDSEEKIGRSACRKIAVSAAAQEIARQVSQ